MHTANSIQAMSDAAVRKIAEALAIELMETPRFKTALAEHVGVERVTVNNYFSDTGRPPVLLVLYLQAEKARRDADGIISDQAKINERIARYARS